MTILHVPADRARACVRASTARVYMHMRTKQHGNNLTTWFVRIQVNEVEARENMGSQKKTKKVSLACCDWLRFSYGSLDAFW